MKERFDEERTRVERNGRKHEKEIMKSGVNNTPSGSNTYISHERFGSMSRVCLYFILFLERIWCSERDGEMRGEPGNMKENEQPLGEGEQHGNNIQQHQGFRSD